MVSQYVLCEAQTSPGAPIHRFDWITLELTVWYGHWMKPPQDELLLTSQIRLMQSLGKEFTEWHNFELSLLSHSYLRATRLILIRKAAGKFTSLCDPGKHFVQKLPITLRWRGVAWLHLPSPLLHRSVSFRCLHVSGEEASPLVSNSCLFVTAPIMLSLFSTVCESRCSLTGRFRSSVEPR